MTLSGQKTEKKPGLRPLPPAVQPLVDCHPDRNQFNRQVHISKDHGFIYFNNPKVACSTLKATLNTAVAERAGETLTYRSMADIHARNFNPLLRPKTLGYRRFATMLAAPDVVRFAFVRDPVSRFCSAYLNKLRGVDRSVIRTWLWTHLGLAAEKDLPIAEFARLAREDEVIRDFNPHWRLQRKHICFDHVDWTMIGNIRSLSTDIETLGERIFGGALAVQDTRTLFGQSTNSASLASELTPATKADIEAAYAADYEMMEEIAARNLHQLQN